MNQAVKEELSLFPAQDLGHGGSVLVFMSGITSNEILEVQVTSQSSTFQNYLGPRSIDNVCTLDVEHRAWRIGELSHVLSRSGIGISVGSHLWGLEEQTDVQNAENGWVNRDFGR